MPFGDTGVKTHRDRFAIAETPEELVDRLMKLREGDPKLIDEYELKDMGDFSINSAQKALQTVDLQTIVRPISYRPLDNRFYINNDHVSDRPRLRTMSHLIDHPNIGLATCRLQSTFDFQHAIVVDRPIDICFVSLQTKETGYLLPLYLFHEDGTSSLSMLIMVTGSNLAP